MDLKTWTNVQDEPVLHAGPEAYDRHGVAMNQVIRYKGRYYGYYHATAFPDWREWSTNVAVSDDLVHWKKYPANPIIGNNRSSGILVFDGELYRLYTMHPEVNLYFPSGMTGNNIFDPTSKHHYLLASRLRLWTRLLQISKG